MKVDHRHDSDLDYCLQLYSWLEREVGLANCEVYGFAIHLAEYWCARHPSTGPHHMFLKLVQKSAEAGHPDAQFEMYCLAHVWELFPKNSGDKWLKLAADNDHVKAILHLAAEAPNESQKLLELERATKLGSKEAARELGKNKLKTNLLEALQLLFSAETAGDAESALVLSGLFQDGHAGGLVKDDDLAKWYLERALDKDQGLLTEETKNDARLKLAKLLLVSPQHDAAAERAFVVLGDVVASEPNSHPEAEYLLGCLLRDGRGCPFSVPKAKHFMRRAAEKGHGAAKNALGKLFSESNRPLSSSDQAKELRRHCMELGLVEKRITSSKKS